MSTMFSRLLVGIDDSEPSLAAVRIAVALAREHDGDLVLCCAADWLPMVAEVEGTGALIDTTPLIAEVRAVCATALARATAIATSAGVSARGVLPDGDAAVNLVQVAAEAGCTLIVMGTHGRSGLSRALLGSTTENVLRHSVVPVLTVHADSASDPGALRTFERIAIGVDESAPSDAAMATVFALPPEDRVHVTFYTVADADVSREDAERIIAAALADAHRHGVDAGGTVLRGRPERQLAVAAHDTQADLLVLGSHGRRGVGRFFLGSVAEEIVRKSPIPVLVVRG